MILDFNSLTESILFPNHVVLYDVNREVEYIDSVDMIHDDYFDLEWFVHMSVMFCSCIQKLDEQN